MLAAHSASGSNVPAARVQRGYTLGRERLVISAKRPELIRTSDLTPAERVVFGLFLEGFSYLEIAHKCRKSVRTVANQLQAARRKCAEAGRAAAVGRLLS